METDHEPQRLYVGLLIVALIIIIGLAGYVFSQKQQTKNTADDTPQPIVEENTLTPEEAVSTIFKAKYGEATAVTITSQTDKHVRGSVKPADQEEGGLFLATKFDNGQWVVVFEGNGGISCTAMTRFGFPDEMLADCYDNADENRAACQTDADCVPLPVCHPHDCINKIFIDKYPAPQVCTELFDYQAAYSAEDCGCVSNVCTNKNLGRTVIE